MKRQIVVAGLTLASGFAACSRSSSSNVAMLASVAPPLRLDAVGELSIDIASSRDAGALSAADWSRFNQKVSAVTAGTGLAQSGTATQPQLSVIFGNDGSSAAVGNDPRLSDARAPLPDSNSYIQNGSTPQDAGFSITGSAAIGGDLSVGGTITGSGAGLTNLSLPTDLVRNDVTAPAVQATYLVAGNGTLPSYDQLPGVLGLIGATTWLITANAAPSLQIIDRSSSVRRGIFDTHGNVFLGGNIACDEGCSAALQYVDATKTLTVAGQVSTHDGRIQRDAAYFDPEGSADSNPVHIKVNLLATSAAAFRFSLEGYNWGSDALVDSKCVGTFVANGLTGQGCADSTHGIATALYVSSDGFLVVRASSPTIAQAGFSLSAAYYFSAAQNDQLRVTYQVIRSATNL